VGASNAIEWGTAVCHNGTSWVRRATLAAVALGIAFGQTAGDATAPNWRRIGNDAVDLPLAAPATGPVDAVWFSPDNTRLYAKSRSGAIFQTVDFENWTPAPAPSEPLPDTPVTIQRLPAPNVKFVSAPGRVFAFGQHVFRSDDGGGSWSNL